MRKRLARLKAAAPAPADTIVESPWLAPEPASPSLGLLLALGTAGGLLLALVQVLLRGRAPARGAPTRRSSPRTSPGRRESLQQRREQRLALAQPARQ